MCRCEGHCSGSVPTEITEPATKGMVVQARIHRNIAKQRLFSNPTDLRQFPDYSLPGAFITEGKNYIVNFAT